MSTIFASQGLRIWPLQSRRPESARRRLLEKIEAARILIKHKMFQVNNHIIQCCGSGLTDPDFDLYPGPADPNPYLFQPNVQLNYNYFSENVNALSKYLKSMTPITLKRMMKQCRPALLWIKVRYFSQIFKHVYWVSLRVRSADPDLDRHRNGKLHPDPDRCQKDADPQHRCYRLSVKRNQRILAAYYTCMYYICAVRFLPQKL
jgi:hypothetical protein